MAGWSESSKAWLNMTGGGCRPGGHRVYWNRVTFVAEWPAAAAQKEDPGNTVDYPTLYYSPVLYTHPHSATVSVVLNPRGFNSSGFTFTPLSVQDMLYKVDNFLILDAQLLFTITPHLFMNFFGNMLVFIN